MVCRTCFLGQWHASFAILDWPNRHLSPPRTNARSFFSEASALPSTRNSEQVRSIMSETQEGATSMPPSHLAEEFKYFDHKVETSLALKVRVGLATNVRHPQWSLTEPSPASPLRISTSFSGILSIGICPLGSRTVLTKPSVNASIPSCTCGGKHRSNSHSK